MAGFFSPLKFFVKGFRHGFFQNEFYGVFELPLLRNAQKRHKQNSKLKERERERYLPTSFSGYLPDIRRFQFCFLRRPLY
jgi:hypothetical protein